MFQQFNRQGHRMLSAEITQELQALAQRHGLDITAGGGQIGTTELVIKVVAKTSDTSAIEAKERRELGMYGRFAGLTEHHYNTIIVEGGTRYQLKGYSPNRPKYPIDMKNLNTGKMHKATEGYGRKFIAAFNARQQQSPAPIASAGAPSTPTPQSPRASTIASMADNAFADAGIPQF
jgi:hypothetical protein